MCISNSPNLKELNTNETLLNKLKEYNIDLPCYLFEEILEYLTLSTKGKCKCMKLENIIVLLNLLVINKQLTYKQADFLKTTLINNEI